ncbi:hypothetical protein D9757_008698 [Collybiopsis confluens]|uniref:Uncharacterized protein n=1 Tax=Collybiopsis confluens TaxID=2823264 RepID=A0A8H5H9J8_9AGAR|nr:hypothetical protein D9757_008698 [Collybiopsis confluens]
MSPTDVSHTNLNLRGLIPFPWTPSSPSPLHTSHPPSTDQVIPHEYAVQPSSTHIISIHASGTLPGPDLRSRPSSLSPSRQPHPIFLIPNRPSSTTLLLRVQQAKESGNPIENLLGELQAEYEEKTSSVASRADYRQDSSRSGSSQSSSEMVQPQSEQYRYGVAVRRLGRWNDLLRVLKKDLESEIEKDEDEGDDSDNDTEETGGSTDIETDDQDQDASDIERKPQLPSHSTETSQSNSITNAWSLTAALRTCWNQACTLLHACTQVRTSKRKFEFAVLEEELELEIWTLKPTLVDYGLKRRRLV